VSARAALAARLDALGEAGAARLLRDVADTTAPPSLLECALVEALERRSREAERLSVELRRLRLDGSPPTLREAARAAVGLLERARGAATIDEAEALDVLALLRAALGAP